MPGSLPTALRFGRLTTTIVLQEQYIALQRLTRMRCHLVHNLTREKQYFLQNLFYKCLPLDFPMYTNILARFKTWL